MTEPAVLYRVAEVIDSRKGADPATSYVAKLLHEGQDKILKKVAEESAEVLLASKDGDQRACHARNGGFVVSLPGAVGSP